MFQILYCKVKVKVKVKLFFGCKTFWKSYLDIEIEIVVIYLSFDTKATIRQSIICNWVIMKIIILYLTIDLFWNRILWIWLLLAVRKLKYINRFSYPLSYVSYLSPNIWAMRGIYIKLISVYNNDWKVCFVWIVFNRFFLQTFIFWSVFITTEVESFVLAAALSQMLPKS